MADWQTFSGWRSGLRAEAGEFCERQSLVAQLGIAVQCEQPSRWLEAGWGDTYWIATACCARLAMTGWLAYKLIIFTPVIQSGTKWSEESR